MPPHRFVAPAFLLSLLLTLSSANVASAQPAEVADGFVVEEGVLYHVRAGTRSAVPLPAAVRALQVVGPRAYVALGDLGAAVVRARHANEQADRPDSVTNSVTDSVIVEKRIPVSHGEVTGFMVEGESVWMQLSSTTAIRLHGDAGVAPAAAPVVAPVAAAVSASVAPPSAPAAAADASAAQPVRLEDLAGLSIVKTFNGQVLLNRGKSSGLRAGDRFKVVRHEQLSDEGGSFEGEHEVAVLVIDSLSADSARALVWRGDHVVMGDRVEPADRNTDPSLSYPRQLHGFIEAEVHLRPLLNIGEAGAGVLMDDHLTYYAEHYYLGLRNEPFGLGRSEGSTAFTQSTFAEGGYNSRPFAIGLAVGFTSVYGDLQEMFEFTSSSDDALSNPNPWQPGRPEQEAWSQGMQHAFALGQRVRLGAMDGLNLSVANTLLYFPGGSDNADGSEAEGGFIWGGTNAKLSVPLAQRADLFFEGGGGVMGYAYGAIGVFCWLRGNGGPGSLGLMASAGGAGVWGARTRRNLRYGYTDTEDIIVAGPMISLGLRYRAGLGQ